MDFTVTPISTSTSRAMFAQARSPEIESSVDSIDKFLNPGFPVDITMVLSPLKSRHVCHVRCTELHRNPFFWPALPRPCGTTGTSRTLVLPTDCEFNCPPSGGAFPAPRLSMTSTRSCLHDTPLVSHPPLQSREPVPTPQLRVQTRSRLWRTRGEYDNHNEARILRSLPPSVIPSFFPISRCYPPVCTATAVLWATAMPAPGPPGPARNLPCTSTRDALHPNVDSPESRTNAAPPGRSRLLWS
ncbi:hypothetical protein MVEN_01888400 [Mycena venus]|uniref:Uncharacterized protein n=1 Tax=Mycena venus TaxID=2733690 RepID=A0A8H6XJE1_9AGAR|nr:hypothetical protein MVEN_01888400 [Mycena venus]